MRPNLARYAVLKKLLVAFILFFPLLGQPAGVQQRFTISFPELFPKATAADIVQLLSQGTSETWRLSNNEKIPAGIVLRYENDPAFTSKESFRIVSNGTNQLTITASATEGLIFGIYKHLRALGFKFYLPDALYTIVPVVTNPFGAKRNAVDQPFAQIRDFFATGGFGSGNSDSTKNVEKSWSLWKLRNGFGAAYPLAGHRGENFILENHDTLAKHPDWLATPLYENGSLNVAAKLNYLNKEAVAFYTNWTIHSFTRPGYKLPAPNITEFVSIEPSDGGGYLNEKASAKKLPTVSDQVYGAANIAAEKLAALFPKNPNIGVNLYAYSSHAEPPSFPLHPRVFVQLVPYQFQNIAFGPSFIKMWAQKVKRFGIYDYFRYPDAQFDLPGGMSLEQVMKRLIFSEKSGAEGTIFETSYSKFSTGIPLWIMGRYLADGDADWNKNINILINDLYPKASVSIQALFTLFYAGLNFASDQLSSAVQLVADATAKTTDPTVKERLAELKQYLYFTHLVLQSRDLSNGSLKDRSLPVANYAWKMYQSKIIDSYRIMQLISYSFLNSNKAAPDYASYHQLHLDWFPETNARKASWSKISQQASLKDAENNFAILKRSYANTRPGTASYSFSEVKAALRIYEAKRDFIVGGSTAGRGYFSVYCAKPVEVTIRYKLTNPTARPKVTVSGIDKDYTTPLLHILQDTAGTATFTIPAGETTLFFNAVANTTYRFHIKVSDGLIYFDGAPRGIMAFYKSFTDESGTYTYEPNYYPSYIYFPPGMSMVDYKVQLNNLQLYAGTKRIESKLIATQAGGFEFRQITLPQETKGKLWKAVIGGNYNYSFLNIPDRYFLLQEK